MAQIAPGCLAFDEDLSAWIDGELDAPRRAAVEAHVASCRACASRVEELRAVDLALRALPVRAGGADLRERLAERLSGAPAPAAAASRREPPRRRRRFASGLALPLAAAAALALYLALRPPRAPEAPSEPVPIAQSREVPEVPEVPASPVPEPRIVAQPEASPTRPQVAERVAPLPTDGDLEALDAEDLAVVLDLDTIEDLPVIANLELLERLLAAEAG